MDSSRLSHSGSTCKNEIDKKGVLRKSHAEFTFTDDKHQTSLSVNGPLEYGVKKLFLNILYIADNHIESTSRNFYCISIVVSEKFTKS